MIQTRNILWIMMFSGVVLHMMCVSNFYLAITVMIKNKPNVNNHTFLPLCQLNTSVVYIQEESKYSSSANLAGEYEWTDGQRNMIIGSTSWLMNIAMLLGGILSQKYGGKVVFGYSKLALAALCCTIPAAAYLGYIYVVIVRILQGVAAGLSISPAINGLISKWVPPVERGKFSSALAGVYFGMAFCNFVNGIILQWLGWRAVFYISGGLGLLWCLAWFCLVFDDPRHHPYISKEELKFIEESIGTTISKDNLPVPWVSILTSVPFLVNLLCQLTTLLTFYTFVYFMPTYLKEVHGFAPQKIGLFSSIPYFLETAFAIGFGTFTDYLLRREILSRTNVRKCSGTVLSGILLGSLVYGRCDLVYILVLITLTVMLLGASACSFNANVIDMSPNFTAILFGIQGFVIGNAGSIVSFIVDFLTASSAKKSIEQWNNVFLVISLIGIVPGLLFVAFADSRVQPWNNVNVFKVDQEDLDTPLNSDPNDI